MASYPLSFPSVTPATERFALDRRQAPTESPFSYAMKVVHTASRWTLQFTFPRMTLPRAEAVVAWGLSLNGMVGTFRYYPNQTITSALTGRSVAIQAYAYNRAVMIGGYAASELSTLRVGQWFTIGNQLLRITEASAVADANGRVTVAFEPELRVNYAAGTAVEFKKPFGLFRLSNSISPTYTLDPDRRPDFGAIDVIEVKE